jgi:hypothetical protein
MARCLDVGQGGSLRLVVLSLNGLGNGRIVSLHPINYALAIVNELLHVAAINVRGKLGYRRGSTLHDVLKNIVQSHTTQGDAQQINEVH